MSATRIRQPDIEFGKAAKAFFACVLPDAPAAVLHVLLDNALLPAAGDVAEVRIEQVVRGHRGKSGVHNPPLANADLVDRGLHVVVNTAPGNATEDPEGSGVGIEQHLVALGGISDQQERPAGAELDVSRLELANVAANQQGLFTPVELEGLAQLELQWHKSGFLPGAAVLAPAADERGYPRVATAITLRLKSLVQRQCGTPVALGPAKISVQPALQLILVRGQHRLRGLATVLGLDAIFGIQPSPNRVPRQSRAPTDFLDRQPVPIP